MVLSKAGKFLCNLRKVKGMTQKQVADRLGVLPKTVSKWETGRGFPDVSVLSALADVLGVSERSLLTGQLVQNTEESGNMRKIKFYVCPHCGSVLQGMGACEVVCCGMPLSPLQVNVNDTEHSVRVSMVEDDYYVEFDHEMCKGHYIGFVAFVGFDRVLLIRLYPEQTAAVRIPRMQRGKIYFYCSEHGLFEYKC